MRCVGTVVRGIRTPIIKEDTNLCETVIDSLMKAKENEGFKFRDRDIIAITEAVVGISEGNYVTVDDIAKDVIEKFPNSYYAHKQLAQICEEMGNIDIAVDEYMRASDINAVDYNLKFKVAKLLNDTQKAQESIKILENLLKVKPDYYEASCLLGDILYEQENYKEAVNVYLQALNYNPDKYELYYSLGMVYTRLNDFQSAKEYYEKAAELNSLLYHAKYDLGHIALLYNEFEEAEQYFEECTNDDDLLDQAYYYLAYISMLKGNKDKAIQYLNIAVEENEELYKKAGKELVFKIIMHKINKPNNNQRLVEKRNLTQKEIKTIKHLEQTGEVVSNLNQNDIKAIRLLKKGLQDRERE